MDFSCIDEVEDLHKYKNVEYESKMSGEVMGRIECSVIIIITANGIESSTANSTSNNTVVPFVFRICLVDGLIIKGISLLWYEPLTEEDKND